MLKTNKKILLWMAIGGTVGGYIPYLWGEVSIISFSGLLFSSIGSIIGILYGYRKTHPKETGLVSLLDPDDDII
jgi:hypothetical protein